MPDARPVANPLALTVLAYLSREPLHPYEMSRRLRDHGDARSVKFTHGSLYTVVRQLAAAGLIAPLDTAREGRRPERTRYAITDQGRAEFHDRLGRMVAEPRCEYPEFVTALSLIGALAPDDVVALLTARLAALADERARTEALIAETLATGVHPLFLVEERYRLAVSLAETTFVEGFIDDITRPETGWREPWAAIHAGHTTEGETP